MCGLLRHPQRATGGLDWTFPGWSWKIRHIHIEEEWRALNLVAPLSTVFSLRIEHHQRRLALKFRPRILVATSHASIDPLTPALVSLYRRPVNQVSSYALLMSRKTAARIFPSLMALLAAVSKWITWSIVQWRALKPT